MFVIDANKKNSGHGFDSVSGVYDFPMGGECYTMFDVCKIPNRTLYGGGCANYYSSATNLNLCCNDCQYFKTRTGKDYEYTEVAGAKVYTTDGDVIYPYHAIGNNDFCSCASGQYGYMTTSLAPNIICFNSCTDIKNCIFTPTGYDLSDCIIYNIASRKKFKGGELVGKKINGNVYYYYSNYYCQYNSNYGQRYWNREPISVKMSIGLLHTDGTITDIYSDTITTRCYCPSTPSCENKCCFERGIGMFLCGERSTNGVIACAGDRLIYDVRYPCGTRFSPSMGRNSNSSCYTQINMNGSNFFTFNSYWVSPSFKNCFVDAEYTYRPDINYQNGNCQYCMISHLASYINTCLYTPLSHCRQEGITVSIE